MEYHFAYEIDIEADSPTEAAKMAMQMVRDPDAIATWDYHYETPDNTINGGRLDVMPNGTIIITDTWEG